MIILHFIEKQVWEEESKSGKIGMNAIIGHGFIPCVNVADVKSLDLTFSTLNDYMILCIDTDKIDAEIKFENYGDGELKEPNIYDTIPVDAVIAMFPYTFDQNDRFVPTREIMDYELINLALEKLHIKYESHQHFHDGTTSTIILLNKQYIIKKASPELLKAEVTFATEYVRIPKLQKVAAYGEDYRYVIYDFVPGDVMHTVSDFKDLTDNLKLITDQYKDFPLEGYGYISHPVESWDDFLREEVNAAKRSFSEVDYLLPQVEEAIKELAKYPFDRKLLHGDFGTHNFISSNNKFVAAIDPIPLVGDKLYDLLYALVSNIDLIPYLSMGFLAGYTGDSEEKITALLKVVLYCRICRCAIYDKEWIEPYLAFGERIFN